jgi:hypothetical protein
LAVAGCISPPNRDLKRDADMQRNKQLLQPDIRGPVDAKRKTPDDPPNPPLDDDVQLLSSDIALEHIQATNRLNQAGTEGLLAVGRYVHDSSAEPEQLREAVRFIASADFSDLDADQSAFMREALATALRHEDVRVRVPASRALHVHGPGAQRTAFLTAIIDPERRVRWAVVQRFSENPSELDRAQREILISYLDAATRQAFGSADRDSDGKLTRAEFAGTDSEFEAMDHDGDNAVSIEEWTSPIPSVVRADVCALLMRLHTKLTLQEKPPRYNPWLPSSDQRDIVQRWRDWSEKLN